MEKYLSPDANPVEKAANLQESSSTDPSAPEGASKKLVTILLVDDDLMMREIGCLLLAELGFNVLVAADGVEAVELFRARREEISLVLCDQLMPRMDGWQTLAALRSIAPGIRVIMISGMGQQDQITGDMYPEHPQVFLKKPYSLERLRDTISQVLGVEPFSA